VKRPPLVPTVVAATVLALVVYAIVRVASAPDGGASAPAGAAAEAGEARIEIPPDEPGTAEALRRLNVMVYYPSLEGDGLVGEPHEIFETRAPGDRAKQIIADLIAGPTSETALPAIPPGTRLRQVYVLDDGTAWIDFSEDLRRGMHGGSTEEIFTVYAIVNSVVLNIPEIRRVGLLLEGEPADTLNGHLDLRRPLPPDTALVLEQVERIVAAGDRRPTPA
jgi:spore germination protein GerM